MQLKDADKKYFLSLKTEDIDAPLMESLFGDTATLIDGKYVVKKSKFNTNDTFVLTKGEYFNTETVTTNCGLFIYNKLLIEPDFKQVVGYVNTPITNSVQGGIERKISAALLEDGITVDQMCSYLDRNSWLSMQFITMLCGSFTMNTLKPIPAVMKEKKKLLDENKEALADGDIVAAVAIETKLKDMARSELKGDPGMDLYDSGARGSFDGSYKEIAIMKGPTYNPVTKKWDVITSNFMEGIEKDEIGSFGNTVVTGAYPKAIGTGVAGYLSKQLNGALQGAVIDLSGNDCGTKGYIETTITPFTSKLNMYTYIIEGDKLVLLTPKVMPKYIGKRVKKRSIMYCVGDKICRYCAGEMNGNIESEYIGLMAARVASTILNGGMKKFHDSSAHTYKIDKNKITL